MPDDNTKQMAQTAAPLWALASGASLVGGLAQFAVTLALGVVYSTTRFIGFVLLSMIISGGITVLLVEASHIAPLVSAVVGGLTGTIPSLIVIRIALQKLLTQNNISVTPGILAELDSPTPPEQQTPKQEDEHV